MPPKLYWNLSSRHLEYSAILTQWAFPSAFPQRLVEPDVDCVAL